MPNFQTEPNSNQELDELGNIVPKNRDIVVDEADIEGAEPLAPKLPSITDNLPTGGE